jgi:hypothetical protein
VEAQFFLESFRSITFNADESLLPLLQHENGIEAKKKAS